MARSKCEGCGRSFKTAQGLAAHSALSACREKSAPDPGHQVAAELAREKQPSTRDRTIFASIVDDLGLSFIIKKVHGEWVPRPGLHGLTYAEALRACERRQALDNLRPPPPPAPEDTEGELMLMLFDAFMNNRDPGTRGDGEISPQLRRQELDSVPDEQWKQRLELQISQAATRDPWDTPLDIARAREALQPKQPFLSEGTASVIMDSSAKIDAHVQRALDFIERLAER